MTDKMWTRAVLKTAIAAGCVTTLFMLFPTLCSYRYTSTAVVNAPAWNKQLVDSAVSLLKPGYIVLRMGLGADSHMLAQMNRKNKTYSHCGIVMIENGYPFVYHSIGGEDNPDERLRRDSACFFFSPAHNSRIAIVQYDLDAREIDQLKKVVNDYYRQRPRFDMKFDLKTDDFLYCAEFVYKAVNKATNNPSYIGTTSYLGYTFVGIDNIFINTHAHLLWENQFR
jgi:hypothetical protein